MSTAEVSEPKQVVDSEATEQREAFRCPQGNAQAIVEIGRRVIHGKVVNESMTGVLIELPGVYRMAIDNITRIKTANGSYYARIVRIEKLGKRRMQFAVVRCDEIPGKMKHRNMLWGTFVGNGGMQNRGFFDHPGLIVAILILVALLVWLTLSNGVPAHLFGRRY